MNIRHIYLKIEPLRNHSPVAPDMLNITNIVSIACAGRGVKMAVGIGVPRILEANFTVLKTDALIAADIKRNVPLRSDHSFCFL